MAFIQLFGLLREQEFGLSQLSQIHFIVLQQLFLALRLFNQLLDLETNGLDRLSPRLIQLDPLVARQTNHRPKTIQLTYVQQTADGLHERQIGLFACLERRLGLIVGRLFFYDKVAIVLAAR